MWRLMICCRFAYVMFSPNHQYLQLQCSNILILAWRCAGVAFLEWRFCDCSPQLLSYCCFLWARPRVWCVLLSHGFVAPRLHLKQGQSCASAASCKMPSLEDGWGTVAEEVALSQDSLAELSELAEACRSETDNSDSLPDMSLWWVNAIKGWASGFARPQPPRTPRTLLSGCSGSCADAMVLKALCHFKLP